MDVGRQFAGRVGGDVMFAAGKLAGQAEPSGVAHEDGVAYGGVAKKA